MPLEGDVEAISPIPRGVPGLDGTVTKERLSSPVGDESLMGGQVL